MYIRNNRKIQIDPSGKELRPEGLELFNVLANDIDLRLSQFHNLTIVHHWHKEMELFLLIDGSVSVKAGDHVVHLKAGEGCFINSGVLHAFSSDDQRPYVFQSIVFGAEIVGGLPDSVFERQLVNPIQETGPDILVFSKSREAMAVINLFNDVFRSCREEADGFEIDVRYGLSRILRTILIHTHGEGIASASKLKEERVKQMLRWIDSHVSDKMTVEKIAASSNISKRECYRLFRQYLRTTPMNCVNQRRIMAAAKRITETDDPFGEIALDCGFPTPNYFSKRFKEQMGLAPREWRKTTKLK